MITVMPLSLRIHLQACTYMTLVIVFAFTYLPLYTTHYLLATATDTFRVREIQVDGEPTQRMSLETASLKY